MSGEQTLKLSVILATYHRAEVLRETLDHLNRQTLAPECYEVIVIDDGSPDHTTDVVADMQKQVGYSLTYLRHENRGPGFTQNRGIRVARAPLILLMADDIFMTPAALDAHLRAHDEHRSPEVAILGNVLQSPNLQRQSLFLRHWDPFQFSDLPDRSELPFTFFWACNISCKRQFMIDHGMFREEMGPAGAASHEDVEVAYRMSLHGLRIIHIKEALGYHYHVDTIDSASQRAYQRGLNWKSFHDLVPVPDLPVRYKVCTWETLGRQFRALFKKGTAAVDGDMSLWRICKLMSSSCVFNRCTVPAFWMPLLHQAERNPMFAPLIRRRMYLGVIYYHFLRGVREGRPS